ncbi:hypothetical protein MBLNU459_g4123t1 [Dothideomycetes sp. NU459]
MTHPGGHLLPVVLFQQILLVRPVSLHVDTIRRWDNLHQIPATGNLTTDETSHFAEQYATVERESRNTLADRSARDHSTADSIRERRSRSRPAHVPEPPKPADLVLSSTQGTLSRRRAQKSPAQSPAVGATFHKGAPSSAPQPGPSRTMPILTPPYTPGLRALKGNPMTRPEDVAQPASYTSSAGPPLPPKIDTAQISSAPDLSDHETFVQGSLDRYMTFVQQELQCANDRDRLELFANFMVHESRLRRDRYSAAFGDMAGEIMDVTRDMWRPLSPVTQRPMAHAATIDAPTHSSTAGTATETETETGTGTGTRRSSYNPVPSSSCSAAELTPATDTESTGDAADRPEDGDASNPWGDKFQPCLSPIPSMAVSTVPDEDSSRGRSASRWWEESAEGSIGRGGRKLERTRQEAKYMSLHPEELMVESSPNLSTPTPSASKQAFEYGPDEYPPEKTGWHEQSGNTAPAFVHASPPNIPSARSKDTVSNLTPRPLSLDVSRLVTLPPPYPRHHPAVNNSHPALSDLRSIHRAIVADVSAIRALLQQNKTEQADGITRERLQHCGKCIDKLAQSLEEDARYDHTITAQIEGDERPELLEQLTLLKWLFEAKEQIQKQHLEVWSQQVKNEYMLNIRHFHMTGQFEAYEHEEKQLNDQLQQSQHRFAEHALSRFNSLLAIVERHVSRGVEMQLSAFWDIAPELLEIVQKIPEDLLGFEIAIPHTELAENPTYHDHPLQYLMTILNHAKQSAYQFIESQTNLFCLLHEVRTATTSASLRLVEMQRGGAGEDAARLHAVMEQTRRDKEDELTEDLKDKVGEVDRQWDAALGIALEQCVERVQVWLQETGGWDESLTV